MISKVSLPAMTNFIAPATTPAAPLHQNARLGGATLGASVSSRVNNAALTAAPKLTNKSGFRSTATSSQTPLDFLGIKQKNAGSRLRIGTGGVKTPIATTLDSIGGPLDLPKASTQLRSTPTAHGARLHDAVNHRLQNSTDVLLSGIAPLQATPRELAMKDMLNNTQPIAGTRSELAMKDMLNGIEPVQPSIKTTLDNIEPLQSSIATRLDNMGSPVQSSFGTALFNRIGGYVEPAASGASAASALKARLLPTDPARINAGRELMSKLHGESQMKWLMQNAPALAVDAGGQGSASTPSLETRPVAAGDLEPRSKAVFGVTLPTPDASLQQAGLFQVADPIKSSSSVKASSSHLPATKQSGTGAGDIASISTGNKGQDDARTANIESHVNRVQQSWGSPTLSRAAADRYIQIGRNVLDDIKAGQEVSVDDRDSAEIQVLTHLRQNPHLTPTERVKLRVIASELRSMQNVLVPPPYGSQAPQIYDDFE
jgi:hypothetical protein